MRILIALTDDPATEAALSIGAKLASNLWANVNLLAVGRDNGDGGAEPDALALSLMNSSKSSFFRSIGEAQTGPNGDQPVAPVLLREGIWDLGRQVMDTKKELKMHLRSGIPDVQIIAEAIEEEVDLVIVGAGTQEPDLTVRQQLPLAVALSAPCSTLVIKDVSEVENIIIGVEKSNLSQSAREMVSQMLTLFKAPAAMYPLPSSQAGEPILSSEMDKLVKIFKAHDLQSVSATDDNLGQTLPELYSKARHYLLVLR